MTFTTYGHKISGENIPIIGTDNLEEAKWHMNNANRNGEYESAFVVYTTSSALVSFKYFGPAKAKVKAINYLKER